MYDVLIKGGMLYDGTGQDAYKADIAVQGDRIVMIGDLSKETAKAVIHAEGKAVTPGFIEPHSHADLTCLIHPEMEGYLRQGVTTVVGGNCGHAMAPLGGEIYRCGIVDFAVQAKADPKYFDLITLMLPKEKAKTALKELYNIDLDWTSLEDYRQKVNASHIGCNIAPLAGYSAIRQAVMGADANREATPEELDRLEAMTEQCMREGAFGLSTGLDPQYMPGLFATDEETVRMLKVVKKYDGIFTSHTFNSRMDGTGNRMDGYRTMLEQAQAAGVRANVSHVHVLGMAATPEDGLKAARDTVDYFEKMESAGLDISYDVIPSPYSTDFTIPYFAFFLRPFVLMSGSRAQLAKNFRVPDFRNMVHMVVKGGMFPTFDPDQPVNYYPLLAVLKHKNPAHVGKVLAVYAQELGKNPLDLVMDLFAEDPDMEANLPMAGFAEANDFLCRHRMAMPCSDGFGCGIDVNFTEDPEIPLYPNPMSIRFIPRFLTAHAKERPEDTIRQMTGFAAERFGIRNRGIIRKNAYADLVVLDMDHIKSCGCDPDPLQYPDGFDYVLVNGKIAVESGKFLRKGNGRMLSKG